MRYDRIGACNPMASRVGFGCMGLSGTYGPVERSASLTVLHAALDAGVNLFDTADVYGGGENERLLGEALRADRQRVLIATKGGATRDAAGHATNDASPEYLRQACEGSLRRLGVDIIDLYYLHRVDPKVPIEDSIAALGELVRQGKVRAIGLSEVSAATLRRANAVHPIAALQTEYSLSTRFAESDLLPTCAELGVSFVAYSPLGRGILSNSPSLREGLADDDARKTIPRFAPEAMGRNGRLFEQLGVIAKREGLDEAQLALAWVLGHPAVPFVIPGTRRADRIRANAVTAEIELSNGVRAELEQLFAMDAVAGARHNDRMLARTGL